MIAVSQNADANRNGQGNADGNDIVASLFPNLNPEQLSAVTTDETHVLVKAGAGTGKTTTLVARCAYLIHTGVEPSSIQVLTFTRRSANEVRSRVEDYLGAQAHGLNASTFHSWCMQLLRGNEKLWGYAGWTIIDTDDQEMLFRAVRGKRTAGFPTAKSIASAYSFARNSGTGLLRVVEERFNMSREEAKAQLVPIVRLYEAKKKENRYLDYDDILVIVGQQLGNNAAVAKWVGEHFPYLLIDEMQDTNPIQWDIILPMATHTSLYCVGDDAQSIYGFRGASFDNIHHFQDVVPDSHVLWLSLNYRSTQSILDVSNWLLEQSPIDYDKRLISNSVPGEKPEIWDFSDEHQAAAWICDEIEQSYEKQLRYKENLLLVRSAWSARATEGALLRRNIPYRFYGGAKLLESAHIRDLLSVLRVIANPFDTLAWMRWLTLYPKIGDVTASKITEQQTESVRGSGLIDTKILPPTGSDLLEDLRPRESDVSATIEVALEHLRPLLAQKYAKNGWDHRQLDYPVLQELARDHTSILSFIEQYLIDPLSITELQSKPVEDAVIVATIHSAKGMEADNVFLVNAGPGQYPNSRSIEEGTVEEERRVLYVALTRARDRLAITRLARSRFTQAKNTSSEEGQAYFFADLPDEFYEFNSRINIPRTLDMNSAPIQDLPEVDLDVKL